MNQQSLDMARLADSLVALRQEIARLGERVAALEAAAGATGPLAPAPSADALSEELLVVISAALAAFLGKRPHIRQIRLLGSAAWAQQGRATIQASHARPG
jgi:methylmalonyl-CoA carboxyltransferase large subunit